MALKMGDVISAVVGNSLKILTQNSVGSTVNLICKLVMSLDFVNSVNNLRHMGLKLSNEPARLVQY